ncbi:glycosyltransferase family 2 protein [Acinetobacter pollinis]|uniref:glycosyltransferase family 2 protein n=2 Tax=Acinetobacter pollinis TaxID=2605270 RepID=UPI001D1937E1|nr:glycosyltransferase family 2 protein [Acinetobacter pollinis]
MMECVDIVMATYNGENYIREQIESIQKQNYEHWHLYISDDASTDGTVSIIKQMASDDSRIRLVSTDKQGGIIANFNKALSFSDANYIFLSDQDDIWMEDRLIKMLTHFKTIELQSPEKSILLFTDLELIRSDNTIISDSFYKYNNLNPKNNMKDNMLIWRSTVYGCSTLFNKNLLHKSFPIPDYASMHDQWLALNAQLNGGLFYYNYTSLKYRQHSNNAVGGAGNNLIGKIKKSKKNLESIRENTNRIKTNLKLNKNLFYKGSDISFAYKVILPNVFFGEKKIQSLFYFILFSI